MEGAVIKKILRSVRNKRRTESGVIRLGAKTMQKTIGKRMAGMSQTAYWKRILRGKVLIRGSTDDLKWEANNVTVTRRMAVQLSKIGQGRPRRRSVLP